MGAQTRYGEGQEKILPLNISAVYIWFNLSSNGYNCVSCSHFLGCVFITLITALEVDPAVQLASVYYSP